MNDRYEDCQAKLLRAVNLLRDAHVNLPEGETKEMITDFLRMVYDLKQTVPLGEKIAAALASKQFYARVPAGYVVRVKPSGPGAYSVAWGHSVSPASCGGEGSFFPYSKSELTQWLLNESWVLTDVMGAPL